MIYLLLLPGALVLWCGDEKKRVTRDTFGENEEEEEEEKEKEKEEEEEEVARVNYTESERVGGGESKNTFFYTHTWVVFCDPSGRRRGILNQVRV